MLILIIQYFYFKKEAKVVPRPRIELGKTDENR